MKYLLNDTVGHKLPALSNQVFPISDFLLSFPEHQKRSNNMQQEDDLSALAKITDFMFVGAVADNFDERIEQKIFHTEIVVNNAKVAAETKGYEQIPVITNFVDESGVNRMKEMIQDNYNQIKEETKQIVIDELERIKNDPGGNIFCGANLPEDNLLFMRYVSSEKTTDQLVKFIDDTDSSIFGCAGIRSLIDKPFFAEERSLAGFMFGEIVNCGEKAALGNLMLTKLKVLQNLINTPLIKMQW
ncbi:hypothetical protein [Mariniphaga sediminis]|uniref:hypothetical protein n=1 Tax=Mariniphaga sediminis TaxID=1628158 RepID=UPI0040373578